MYTVLYKYHVLCNLLHRIDKYVDQHKFSIMHSCYSWHKCTYQSEQALKTVAHQCKYGITQHSVLDLTVHILMSPDSVPNCWRGPGPEMIPTAGPPGGRPFTRQPHQYLPQPPYMFASYQPQHQVSNWHSINSLKPETNLSGIKKNQFLHHRKHYVCITDASNLSGEVTLFIVGRVKKSLCVRNSFWTLGR